MAYAPAIIPWKMSLFEFNCTFITHKINFPQLQAVLNIASNSLQVKYSRTEARESTRIIVHNKSNTKRVRALLSTINQTQTETSNNWKIACSHNTSLNEAENGVSFTNHLYGQIAMSVAQFFDMAWPGIEKSLPAAQPTAPLSGS